MKRIKRYLKILAFALLIMLSATGLGLPISMFLASRFFVKENHKEQIDERDVKEDVYELD